MNSSFSLEKKVLIMGYFGWYNAGDDSIGYVILKELYKRYPNYKFTVSVKDPYFISKNGLDGVDVVDFSLVSLLKAIRRSDEFIITGGTHFQDEDQFRFRRLKINLFFLFLVIYSKILGKSPILLGHGIGPISSTLTRLMVKIILKYSKSIIVRDHESSLIVEDLGYSKKCNETFDLATGLLNGSFETDNKNKKFKTLGISLISAYEIYYGDAEKDNLLAKEIANSIFKLLQDNKIVEVKLFAFRSGNLHSDEKLLNVLSDSLTMSFNRVINISYEGDVLKFLSEISQCDGFIGMRYHSLIFSYILEKPFISINYMEKCKNLTKQINLSNDAILELDEVKSASISKKLEAMVSYPNKYKAKKPVMDAIELEQRSFCVLEDII